MNLYIEYLNWTKSEVCSTPYFQILWDEPPLHFPPPLLSQKEQNLWLKCCTVSVFSEMWMKPWNLQVLVVIQVCIEGCLSSSTISNNMERGKRAAGDLLPWTISQQFLVGYYYRWDYDFYSCFLPLFLLLTATFFRFKLYGWFILFKLYSVYIFDSRSLHGMSWVIKQCWKFGVLDLIGSWVYWRLFSFALTYERILQEIARYRITVRNLTYLVFVIIKSTVCINK